MNPQEILDRYRDLVAVNSERIAQELSAQLRKKTLPEQRQHFANVASSGFFFLYRDPVVHPDKVLECVVSPAGDAITSVYIGNHAMVSDMGTLIGAREALQRAISEKIGLSIEAIGVDDPGRGRALGLKELSTAQLIDLLAEQMGASVMTTSSVGMDAALAGA